ncbi:MAG: hypothetical protein HYT08_02760 [Candidatus Levybacteria bacterium]|nr:hypothetical protein [Candidatus Levybacteria bacterium]
MPKQRRLINLLKAKEISFLDKFLTWALTIGRMVVIITEIIALSAFLYRFSLDRQLIDLHSDIRAKEALVSSLKNSEETYRNLQDRLATAAIFSKTGEEEYTIFKDIVSFIPQGMKLDQVSISHDRIQIDANYQFISSLTAFINALKGYPKISSVNINKIENKLSTAVISVGITASIAQDNNSNE